MMEINPQNKKSPEDSTEKDKEVRKNIFEIAKTRLKRLYGVDNLTTIEAARLWSITEEVLKDGKKYTQTVKDNPEGKHPGTNMFSLHEETIARWLYNLYDYRINDIPCTYVVDGCVIIKNKFELSQKIEELKSRGRNHPHIEAIPTEEFKKYFKKVREEAHQP